MKKGRSIEGSASSQISNLATTTALFGSFERSDGGLSSNKLEKGVVALILLLVLAALGLE
jgi:hypothetical protein